MIIETVLLVVQTFLMLYFKEGVLLYVAESVLLAVMLLLNIKPITELAKLIFTKFLKRGKKNL